MMLRSELSKNWIHYLPIVTNSLNNSPLESLGFLKPSDIRTEADSVKAYLVEHSYSSGPYCYRMGPGETLSEKNRMMKNRILARGAYLLFYFSL